MRLHALIADKPGSRKSRRRVGRGEGSGRGKTSGKGHKGQKARTGGSVRVGFESGHIPLFRRLPMRGFNNARYTQHYEIVNLEDLGKVEGDVVNRETLQAVGLIRNNRNPVKLLGDGEVSRALKVEVGRASAAAVEKIKAAGGEVTETLPRKEKKQAEASEEAK